jgi:non-specific serine/threonine protein kinase
MQYTYGRWIIDTDRRELRNDGTVSPVGGRAFEILEALVRAAGEVVTKADLLERIWPGAVVSENALEAHISSLRKAFPPCAKPSVLTEACLRPYPDAVTR